VPLGFQQRYNAPGYVYIAGSLSGRVIKFGTAVDITQRENQLRKERHAGLDDWEVLFFIKVDQAGRVEDEASKRTPGKHVYRNYIKDNVAQTAIEVFEGSFSDALTALTEVLGGLDAYETWQWTRARDYDFRKSMQVA
jgi:hypothetical protein